ncbi:MAG: branched chain amino acid aminotransferase, partial [Spirochaetales bacterium]
MAFALEMYPISYLATYDAHTKTWSEQWIESDRVTFADLQALSNDEKEKILTNRNRLGLPTVSYTSQYGYGCFEGMKAFPTKDGSVSIFRPEKNAHRFADSMRGLYCPVF